MSEAPLKLGKYEILRELGRGAMGVVYEAFDPSIERTVALKTIRRDQLEGDAAADVITRFQREAKAAGRLNHPNIVSIYDFGDDNNTTFIAMEFVIGRELKSHFEKDERFPIAEITRIMGELLDALEYSHNYGVVHRDIKPANIIIRPNGQVKVADFGIARIESSQYTQAGTVLGTPAYMSPEQFMGQTVDRRSDIFSAGVVLYQFLTGERPFTGSATTIMHKVLSVDPPPPSRLNVQAPKPFDAVIAKAIAKRPDDRFQTASEFADAIRLAAEGKPVPGLAPAAAADADATVINPGAHATANTTAGRSGTSSMQGTTGAAGTAGAQTAAMRKIFICYRRAEAEYAAGALGRDLRRHFGNEQVFRDREDIDGGDSWKKRALTEIDRDSAVLVLISKEWTCCTDELGNRRLENLHDPIRLEICDGIASSAAIIPVLLENSQMPNESELPPALKPMADFHALRLRDGDWQHDLDAICKTLERAGFKPVATAERSAALKMPAEDRTSGTTVSPIPKSLTLAAAAVVAASVGAVSYFVLSRAPTDAPAITTVTPVVGTVSVPAPVAAVPVEPGTMIISAVGLADPSDQKYQADKALLAADVRADSKSQLVEKAIALYLDRASLAKNYDLLRDRLLSKSGSYIASIVQEGAPELGKDGLMYVTTQAAVRIREVQKSLNQMSRDERIDFIRNNGDPKISVAISVRGDGAAAAPQNSQVAENLLKERIKSFGFRIWTDDTQAPVAPGKGADFAVIGEARLKKLSARLAASGISIEKYMLTSWTVKCVDKQSGEEIYYNNKLPVAAGSWATEEQALAAIGGKIADEFSRDFFVRHFNASGQKVALKITACRTKAWKPRSHANWSACRRSSASRVAPAQRSFTTCSSPGARDR